MPSDRIDQLTPRQLECLRLVNRGLSSKEIAKELGISYHTVDDHLKHAIDTLGVRTRFDASRLLNEHENTPPVLGTQPPDVDLPVTEPSEPHPDRSNAQPWWAKLPLRRTGGRSNDLTIVQRFAWVIILAVALLFGLSQFANIMAVVLSIAQGRDS